MDCKENGLHLKIEVRIILTHVKFDDMNSIHTYGVRLTALPNSGRSLYEVGDTRNTLKLPKSGVVSVHITDSTTSFMS